MGNHKTPAMAVPQSREACALALKQYGILKTEAERIEGDTNDKIAALTAEMEINVAPLREKTEALRQAVQAYCDAHRNVLTEEGKKKFFDFTTGRVKWRAGTDVIEIDTAQEVAAIKAIRALKLSTCLQATIKFVKPQLKKLSDETLAKIPGVSRTTKPETFVIEPFEATADRVPENAAGAAA